MKKLNISGSIQRKTLIRSTLESLEDVLKHAVIRSGAPLKCLSEKIFEMCFPVVNNLVTPYIKEFPSHELYIDLQFIGRHQSISLRPHQSQTPFVGERRFSNKQ